MEVGLFSPLVAHVILIVFGVISVVALVGIAYHYSLVISNRSKFARLDALERELKSVQADLKDIKAQLVKHQLKEGVPVDKGVPKTAVNVAAPDNNAGAMKKEVWQAFIDDYNNLAHSMNVPKAAAACENFVRSNRLHLLICVDPSDAETGNPLDAPVDEVELSNFWGWNVNGKADVFAVVPNPLVEYNEELHRRKGLKETFASNYESGRFKEIEVKIPAQFTQRMGAWQIVQPGVIRVK